MAPRTETRARLLRAAAELFRRQGYNGTGLNQVLATGAAPKGSLYFHFPGGKEQVAAEAVTLAGDELTQTFAELVAAASDPRHAILGLGQFFADNLQASEFRDGCPVATVALEESGDSEPIRAACDGVYGSWLHGLAVSLAAWGVAGDEAGPLAAFVLSSLQGALLLARVQRDVEVIHQVAERAGDLVSESVERSARHQSTTSPQEGR